MTSEKLRRLQAIATIISSIAIPFIIAIMGWWFQSTISNEGLKKDYVQIATNILKDRRNQDDQELRTWAVSILNSNSPIPFSKDLRSKLEEGIISINHRQVAVCPKFPIPPASLMQPPIETQFIKKNAEYLKKLCDTKNHNCRTSIETILFLSREAEINTLKLKSLQELYQKICEANPDYCDK